MIDLPSHVIRADGLRGLSIEPAENEDLQIKRLVGLLRERGSDGLALQS